MIAHEYKHFIGGGTGLRSLLDTYVYLRNKGAAMNMSYVAAELEKMGITEFEAKNRSLAMHLFGGGELTDEEGKMLEYILSSGTYGTLANHVNNRFAKLGDKPFRRVRYVSGRLFLPMETVRMSFPVFGRYPVLLPFLPFYRLFQVLTKRRERISREMRMLAAGGTDPGEREKTGR